MTEARGALSVRLGQRAPIPLQVEFECAPGEMLALVGPSGSGKSTVLRCIAGLFTPDRGSVECNGTAWLDLARGINAPPQARSVGFVFQHYALFPHLSALDNVAAALGHLPRERREARARELLARVHLEGLEARKPAQLSGGQQQRVAVARALAREPRVLLMDEPFSAVDQVTRRKLQRELALLREALRVPIVLVTHDLEEARMLADRLCILHRGCTLQAGAPGEVLARPASALVARLAGHTNLFESVVREHRSDPPATLLDWGGRILEARPHPEFAPGERVAWVIPAEHVILHRRDRPSRGEHENPVSGIAEECIALGEFTSVVMRVDHAAGLPLAMTVSTHAARRNGLMRGTALVVSLLAEGIHLMRAEDAVAGR